MGSLSRAQIQTLEAVDRNIKDLFSSDASGHDYDHIKRVVNLTARLLVDKANPFVALMIAYMHDVFDDKLSFENRCLSQYIEQWKLDLAGFETEIEEGILSIGFKNGRKIVRSLEARIVSDADLIDAMGAVGIARAFYYAGFKGLPFHNKDLEGIVADDYHEYRNLKRNAIAHFDEKLLKLIDYVETDKAKVIARERHDVLVAFYNQFMREI